MISKIQIRNNLRIKQPDSELREYLKDILTTPNPEWETAQSFGRWAGDIPKYILQYKEEGEDLIAPRGILEHVLEDLGREWEIEDERVTPESEKIWGEGNIILRPGDQEPAIREMLSHDNGFLSAPAGSGKTVLGLEIARRLGLKALWLTHRGELKDQTIEAAVEFLEIPRERIGEFHGKTWKMGEQLTVGMIPTLRKRDLSAIEKEFGVIIIDEAHHVPSSTFLHVIDKFYAKFIYGLTATAYRRDKLEAIMFNAIGPKVSEIEHAELFKDEKLMIPTIKRRYTHWDPPEALQMEYHDFMEAMVVDRSRNELIVNDVVKECISPKNTFVILVERTKHAEILTDLLQKKGIKCELCVGSVDVQETDSESENGKKKRKRKKKRIIPKKVRDKIVSDFKEGRIQGLIATYDLLAEGFNYKPLNRLFMASPIRWRGLVIQSIGRVQRPSEGKKNPLVFDYIDERISMFERQAEARLHGVYLEMKMPVIETQR